MTGRVQPGNTASRLSLAALGVGSLVFAIITIMVATDNQHLATLNQSLYQTLQAHRSQGLDTVMMLFTAIGDAGVTVPLTVSVLAWMLWLRVWRSAVYWGVAAAFGTVMVGLLKNLMQVVRPQDLYTGLSNFSYPSGHSTMSVVVYGMLAFFISLGLPAGRRWWPFLLAAILAFGIGFSRLYLGAHWLSDVLGGFALALAWVALLAFSWQHAKPCAERVTALAPLSLLVFLIATGWHVYHGSEDARIRYQQTDEPAYGGTGRVPLQDFFTVRLGIATRHSRGPVWCTDSPWLSTATVTGISITSNS